jgi:murein DD-endopeptidase MepM/ murein hydrolase activator NlpD
MSLAWFALAGCAIDGRTVAPPGAPPVAAPTDTAEEGSTSSTPPTPGPADSAPAEPTPTVRIVTDGACENPCALAAEASSSVATVRWSAEGWPLGDGVLPDFAIAYTFTRIGPRFVRAEGVDAAGAEVAVDEREIVVHGACPSYTSTEQEYAPVQRAEASPPPGADAITWAAPAAATWIAPFAGTPGATATHEGIDYVNDDRAQATVPVVAAADGVVVYVREGCPQSATFGSNQTLRECGSGWGNHVIVRHEGGLYTRYAHLERASALVRPGDPVSVGDRLASMGNSGRSDVRHLHFELGTDGADPDPCAPATSFDAVHDPAAVGL